jgi:hypothetical protein
MPQTTIIRLRRNLNGQVFGELTVLPSNCIWAQRHTQDRNKRTNRVITFRGASRTITDWARTLGVCPKTLAFRLRRWTLEKALTTPAAR